MRGRKTWIYYHETAVYEKMCFTCWLARVEHVVLEAQKKGLLIIKHLTPFSGNANAVSTI